MIAELALTTIFIIAPISTEYPTIPKNRIRYLQRKIFVLAPISTECPKIPRSHIEHVHKSLIKENLTQEDINRLFNDPRLKRCQKPPEGSVDWEELRAELLSEESLSLGLELLQEHAETFAEAEKGYGVEKKELGALVGIESFHGTNPGAYFAFNLFYYKLSHKDWRRHANQFTQFIVYCKKLKLDCLSVTGSHDGAIGPVQFMPENYKHARDGNGDGVVNLFDIDDAIMSAAHLLKLNGWGNSLKSKKRALGRYFGSAANYPRVTLDLAEALKAKK